MIRHAERADLARLQDIEIAAGRVFLDVGMSRIANDDPPSLDSLSAYVDAGHAWVAADSSGRPVGYLLADLVDGGVHIEQVTVDPSYAGQRIGRRLIENLAEWAVASGARRLTLTTFRDVPWNAPYYARLGFSVVPESDWTDGIRCLVEGEVAHGLHEWPRVVMARALRPVP